MIEKYGDLFDTDATCIGHGVNTVGVMGAGIAKTFREKYDSNYQNYRLRCERGSLVPGSVFSWPFNHDNKLIFNIASQDDPGPFAQYDWLFDACLASAKRAKMFGYDRIAIPEIGCGIGGLVWPKVKTLLEAIEVLVPGFQWEVWHYEG